MIRCSLQYKSKVKFYGFDLFLENVTKSDIKNEFLKMPKTYKHINDKLQEISENMYVKTQQIMVDISKKMLMI
jgi:hypothetical protein